MGVPPATLSDNLTVVISSPSSSLLLQALKVIAEKRVTAATAKKLKWLVFDQWKLAQFNNLNMESHWDPHFCVTEPYKDLENKDSEGKVY